MSNDLTLDVKPWNTGENFPASCRRTSEAGENLMGTVTDMATKTKQPETMSAAEFKVLRERLGLPAAWMARSLGTFERTLSRWENGAHPVREDAVTLLRAMDAHTEKSVASAVLRHKAGAVLKTYRHDNSVPPAAGQLVPASWHRAMIGRVVAELDGAVSIVYAD